MADQNSEMKAGSAIAKAGGLAAAGCLKATVLTGAIAAADILAGGLITLIAGCAALYFTGDSEKGRKR